MIYKLSRKIFGTRSIKALLKIETVDPIEDMCYVDGLGLVFSTDCYLGLISESLDYIFPWKGSEGSEKTYNSNPTFGKLSNMSYCKLSNSLMVVEDGGEGVRKINIANQYVESLLQGNVSKSVKNLIKKHDKTNTYIQLCGHNKFYFAVKELSKCFMIDDSKVHNFAGDGKTRFSMGQDLTSTSIGVPSGMCFCNGELFLSDSLNGVVRSIKDGKISLVYGNPTEHLLTEPSKLTVSEAVIYLLCKNSIMSFIIGKDNPVGHAIYESDTLSNIAADSDKGLYILEELDA